ncbi:uncharacterized protein MONOS_17790 [Monocercomonoides exilis]|uniref:uncharacterized protein n=1 Tax=Monocercomonoides exilis TaxID=2049356 RepID=UPI00355A9B86|nr:hypothetical protein MONOS_17790 [Monocercomonoides exilis]
MAQSDFQLTKKIREDFEKAKEFAESTHKEDIDWIKSRVSLTEDFDDFFDNYIYVIIASGFRAMVAARISKKLFECKGDMDKMREIFKNEKKLQAIKDVWDMKKDWSKIRSTITDVDSLKQFPRIGDIVKYHLARNIGLISCGKPDVHLVRYCEGYNCDDPHVLINALSKEVNLLPGTVDFILWIWLSHGKGTKKAACCNGGYPLR